MINKYSEKFSQFGQAVNTSSLISCANLQGRIIYVNNNFCELSGYSNEELLGQPHHIISSNFHSKEFWNQMWTTIAKGKTWRKDVRNKAKDGSYYWVDTFIYPVCQRGKVVEYLSIRNNITDKKKQECEILQQNNVLSKIAWLQSHGLRRPVSSILGLIQLFQDENNTDKDLQKLMIHLKKMSDELDDQIKEIVRLTEEVKSTVINLNSLTNIQ